MPIAPLDGLKGGLGTSVERAAHLLGYECIAGVDEVGRGAWAGPVSAAAVVLPVSMARMPELLPEVTDSKRLTPGARAVMAVQISQIALGVGVGHSLPGEIDSLGILLATRLAMLRALRALALPVDFVIVDGPPLVRLSALLPDARQEHIVDGDRRVLSVAAASIVAKVARDGIMSRLEGSRARARYGFRRHKGYGTPDHVRALLQFGSSPYHRLTWRPMRLLGARESIPQLHHG